MGDAESLPFKDRSFDWVISNFSLHWTDLRKSVPELFRVARVGVGVALPVEGSLKGIGFPFPERGPGDRSIPPPPGGQGKGGEDPLLRMGSCQVLPLHRVLA
ncbi:MAG: methyltransferase domain-containing protein [Aquificota bacterium]|nr:methyltransferase domain-containing protein [Aquificota bacterium]